MKVDGMTGIVKNVGQGSGLKVESAILGRYAKGYISFQRCFQGSPRT